jgi:hypothetical protein
MTQIIYTDVLRNCKLVSTIATNKLAFLWHALTQSKAKKLQKVSTTMTQELPPTTLPTAEEPTTQKRARGRPKVGIGSSENGTGSNPSVTPQRGKASVERQIDEIEAGLGGLFGAMSELIGNFDQFDKMIIQMQSPPFVAAVCRAAKTDSRLRGWLLSVVHVSAYSDIALYASMMIVPIVLHHFPGLLTSMPIGNSNGYKED